MSRTLIGFVALIYALTALLKAEAGQWPKAIMWMAYAIANLGLMMDD